MRRQTTRRLTPCFGRSVWIVRWPNGSGPRVGFIAEQVKKLGDDHRRCAPYPYPREIKVRNVDIDAVAYLVTASKTTRLDERLDRSFQDPSDFPGDTRTVSGRTPHSSNASRKAAVSAVSEGSRVPPGNEICPPCRGSVPARSVKRMWGFPSRG